MTIKKPSDASRKIQAIYSRFGGTNKTARKLGISRQLLSNWKRRGSVPLKRVAWMSLELKCNPFELNQIETTFLYEVAKKWC